MTKTKLTKEIEQALVKRIAIGNLKSQYGAIEVPTGSWVGRGKENIDFATYSPRNQEISCFEIKVTKSDFNSNASLSFLGNKNYLVVPYDLGRYLADNWHNHKVTDTWTHSNLALSGIGVLAYFPYNYDAIMENYRDESIRDQVLHDYSHASNHFVTLIKCKRKEIHLAQKISLIEGILRAGCRDAEKAYLEGKYL